jgi:hypothetical protein
MIPFINSTELNSKINHISNEDEKKSLMLQLSEILSEHKKTEYEINQLKTEGNGLNLKKQVIETRLAIPFDDRVALRRNKRLTRVSNVTNF